MSLPNRLGLSGHRRAILHNADHLQGHPADRPTRRSSWRTSPHHSCWLLWLCWISSSRSVASVTITKGSRASRVGARSKVSSQEDGMHTHKHSHTPLHASQCPLLLGDRSSLSTVYCVVTKFMEFVKRDKAW